MKQDIDERLGDRLYQDLARRLMSELAAGRFPVGGSLPGEREMAARYNVSRSTLRAAMITLEVLGLVEVRNGSGTFVRRLPGRSEVPQCGMSRIEITEARLLFEGEAAALAATEITDSELVEIECLALAIVECGTAHEQVERADRKFHLAIARAARNNAIYEALDHLWERHGSLPEAGQWRAVRPMIKEHAAIVEAMQCRDPAAARAATRTHLSAELDCLLFVAEQQATGRARSELRARRERYRRLAG